MVSSKLFNRTLKLRFAPGQRGGNIKIQIVMEEIFIFSDLGVKSRLNLPHFFPAKHLYLRDEKNKNQYGGKSICNRKCQPYAVKLPVVW